MVVTGWLAWCSIMSLVCWKKKSVKFAFSIILVQLKGQLTFSPWLFCQRTVSSMLFIICTRNHCEQKKETTNGSVIVPVFMEIKENYWNEPRKYSNQTWWYLTTHSACFLLNVEGKLWQNTIFYLNFFSHSFSIKHWLIYWNIFN